MNRTAKVAVSLPADILRSVERVRRKLGKSRSAVVAEALDDWLRARELSEADRRYVRGYARIPEAPEEIAATDAIAADAMAGWEPWE
jgi:metal-responsive CopG/Arc/MetJ family transcriptional regulator